MEKIELAESLLERVEELIESHKDRPILSTMGLQSKVDELVLRNQGLEEAIRELALEVQRLEALQED